MMVKINKILSKINNRKGQGIVEYALLLAFVVGIAMMLNGSNIGGAVNGVFDKVALVLGGGEKYDLSTADGRLAADKSNMKKILNAFLNSFSEDPDHMQNWNTIVDGKLVMQKNFAIMYVFPDGTADLYVDGSGYKGYESFWLSQLDSNDPRRELYTGTLKNAGVDLFNADSMKINSAVDGGDLQKGYAVVLSKTGEVSYWGVRSTTSFNSTDFRRTDGNGVDKTRLAQAAEGILGYSNTHTKLNDSYYD